MESSSGENNGTHGNGCGFTKAERCIFELVAKGMTRNQIAKRRNISIHTVKTHIEHIYEKLGVHNAASAISKMWGEYLADDDAGED
jgi:DNA-binding CsgD family transcriptional regulator